MAYGGGNETTSRRLMSFSEVARHPEESEQPERWQGLLVAWIPAFGPQYRLINFTGRGGYGVPTGTPLWHRKWGGWGSDHQNTEAGWIHEASNNASFDMAGGPQTVCITALVSSGGQTNWGVFFSRGLYQSSGYYVQVGSGSGQTELYHNLNKSGSRVFINTTGNPLDPRNQADTFALVYDPVNVAQAIWVNGAKRTDIGQTGTPDNTYPSSSGLDFYIGRYNSTGNQFDGTLQRVMVYNRVLTPAELYRDYADPYGLFKKRNGGLLFAGGVATAAAGGPAAGLRTLGLTGVGI